MHQQRASSRKQQRLFRRRNRHLLPTRVKVLPSHALIPSSRGRGFTIVELVVVLLLLGILSVYAGSRFVRPSAFAPTTVAHAIVDVVRYAHQLAVSRQDALVTMTLIESGTELRLTVSTDVDGTALSETVSHYGLTIDASSGAATATLDATTGLTLQFAASGDLDSVLIGGSTGDAASGAELALSGDTARTLCVYPTGYVANAACS